MKELKARLTFIEGLLGTANSDPNIHEEFIASKSPDAPSREEEIAALGVDEVIQRGKTIFSRDENGNPMLWDYQIKGFFKDACGALRKVTGSESSKIKAYKKEIDGLIFPQPRKIIIHTTEEIGSCQRPLRANTPQGERTTLANSEEIAASSYIDITIKCLCDSHMAVVKEWLDYGELKGLGQWRNSGKGRFVWEELK